MQPPEGQPAVSSELTLSDYLAIFFRHRVVLISVMSMVLAGSLLFSLVTSPKYESTASVLLRTNTNDQLFPPVSTTQRAQFTRQPGAELEYVLSTAFDNEATAASPSGASVDPRYDADDAKKSQLEFVATASSPDAAQAAANEWARFYLESRAEAERGEVAATITALEASIEELEAEKATLLLPLKPIDDALLTETDSDTISRLTTQRLSLRQALEDELLPISLQLRSVSQELSNLRISVGFLDRPDNSARISIEAEPGRQVAPNVTRNLLVGGALGFVAAVASVLAVESFRKVIHSVHDIEAISPLPVLARLPEFPKDTTAPMQLAADTGGPYAQSLERIVSALLYERVGRPGQRMSVLFTSSLQSEGKTTVASHLAYRLISAPTRSILIDADLRRPDVHNAFGVKQTGAGLGDLLHSRESLDAHLLELVDAPHVRLLFAGRPTDDAATLLRQSFGPAVESLPRDYDLLLIDAPPVLAVTDAEVLTHSADVVVLVVRAGRTTQPQLRETLKKLEAAGADVMGFVLVGAKSTAGSNYADYYSYEADPSKTAAPAPVVELQPSKVRARREPNRPLRREDDRGSASSIFAAGNGGRGDNPRSRPSEAGSKSPRTSATRPKSRTRTRPESASERRLGADERDGLSTEAVVVDRDEPEDADDVMPGWLDDIRVRDRADTKGTP